MYIVEKELKMKDTYKTKVIFKMTPEEERFPSECIAFLPGVPAMTDTIMSYMHVGQHGEAAIEFFYECSLATEEQYKDLKEELESIGYNLSISKKLGRK